MTKIHLTCAIESNGKLFTQSSPGGLPVRDKVARTIMLDGYSDEEVLNKILINVAGVYTTSQYGTNVDGKWQRKFFKFREMIQNFIINRRFRRK